MCDVLPVNTKQGIATKFKNFDQVSGLINQQVEALMVLHSEHSLDDETAEKLDSELGQILQNLFPE